MMSQLSVQGIRRIYFSDRLYSEEELPPEFKLFLPVGILLVSQGRPKRLGTWVDIDEL